MRAGEWRPALIYTSRSGRVVEDGVPNLISNGSCFSITVLCKRLRSSVSTCPFRIQHTTFSADEMHPPANELLPFGLKGIKGRRSQLRDGISRSSGKAEYVDFSLVVLAVSCGSQ